MSCLSHSRPSAKLDAPSLVFSHGWDSETCLFAYLSLYFLVFPIPASLYLFSLQRALHAVLYTSSQFCDLWMSPPHTQCLVLPVRSRSLGRSGTSLISVIPYPFYMLVSLLVSPCFVEYASSEPAVLLVSWWLCYPGCTCTL